MRGGEEVIEYAIYQGDTFLFIDTLENCAKRLEVSTDTIRWLTSPTAFRRLDAGLGNRRVAIKLDDRPKKSKKKKGIKS